MKDFYFDDFLEKMSDSESFKLEHAKYIWFDNNFVVHLLTCKLQICILKSFEFNNV